MKKTNLKRITILVALTCLTLGLTSCGGEKATPAKDFVTLEINGEAIISSYKGKATDIIIPSKIKGKPVTTISDGAFNEMKQITSVKLPQGIKKLGKSAFNGCVQLVSVTLSEGIPEIGENTFRDCEKLESIIIPSTVKSIGKNAFKNCSALKEIIIPEGVESIGETAFIDCSSLSKVSLPATITSVGLKAFFNTSDLDLIMPASAGFCLSRMNKNLNVKVFGSYTTEQIAEFGNAMKAMTNGLLVSLDISDATGSGVIGTKSFYSNTHLTKVILPKDITKIEERAFSRSDFLKEVILPEGLLEIEEDAFLNCEALTSIIIPDSVLKLGKTVFNGCDSVSNITIGSGLNKIPEGAFCGCNNLSIITIPANIKDIERNAFECEKLKTVNYRGPKDQLHYIKNSKYGWDDSFPEYTIISFDYSGE